MSDALARARGRAAAAGQGGWREVVDAHRRAGLWPLVRLGDDHGPVDLDLDRLHAYALRLPGAARETHATGARPLIHRWPDGWAPLGITCALFAASRARPGRDDKADRRVLRVDQVLLAVRADGAALVAIHRANRGAWAAWDPHVTETRQGSVVNPWSAPRGWTLGPDKDGAPQFTHHGAGLWHRSWSELDPDRPDGPGGGTPHMVNLRAWCCCGGGAFGLYCWQAIACALARATGTPEPTWAHAADPMAERAHYTGRAPDGLTWEQVKDWHHAYDRWRQGGERAPSRRRHKAREARRCVRVALEGAPAAPLFPEGDPGQDRGPDEPEMWPTEELDG